MTEHTCEGEAGTDCPACAAEVARQRTLWHPALRPLAPHERVWRPREDYIRDYDKEET